MLCHYQLVSGGRNANYLFNKRIKLSNSRYVIMCIGAPYVPSHQFSVSIKVTVTWLIYSKSILSPERHESTSRNCFTMTYVYWMWLNCIYITNQFFQLYTIWPMSRDWYLKKRNNIMPKYFFVYGIEKLEYQ